MSRKPRKIVSRCYCGRKLRKKDKRCQRCDRMTRRGMEASLRKAAASAAGPALTGRAGRSVVSKAAAKMAASAGQVVKTANPVTDPDGRWTRMQYHPDPQWRLFAYDKLHKSQGGRGTGGAA
jgi:hypothetical protein